LTDDSTRRDLCEYAEGDEEFADWLVQANDVVEQELEGLSLLDLEEWVWRASYDGGDDPGEAALECLDELGYGDSSARYRR
jgi:hypothetical protein